MDDRKQITNRIIESLLVEYSAVYYIDAATGSYYLYCINPKYESLNIELTGDDFFANEVPYAERTIHPEDLPMVEEFFSRENMMRSDPDKGQQSIVYRLMMDGKPVFYSAHLIRTQSNGSDFFILGIRDVDLAVKRERKQARMERERDIFNQIAQSLAKQYDTIFYLDLETDYYMEFSDHDFYRRLEVAQSGVDFYSEAARNTRRIVYAEDRDKMLSFFRKGSILKLLEEKNGYSIDYRLDVDGKLRYTRLSLFYASDRRHAIMCVKDVDAEIRQEMERKKQEERNLTYNQITLTLANRYEILYFVNTETGHFDKYAPPKYGEDEMTIVKSRDDFYKDCEEEIRSFVVPEDREKVRASLKPEKLYEYRDKHEVGTEVFCINRKGIIAYMEMRIAWTMDEKNMVVGLVNVTSRVTKEKERTKQLQSVTEQAERDALTGVKNMTAYQKFEMQMQHGIERGEQEDFAIVVCDLNNLKLINDTEGHKAGDRKICEACDLICRTYAHSPVFRIGGDEFCVILRGTDYQSKDYLLNMFRDGILHNREEGGVVVAAGMAVYDRKKDESVQQVFERADSQMYANKRSLKK